MRQFYKYLVTFLVVIAITISISFKSSYFEIAKQIEIFTTLYKELNLYYVDEVNPADLMNTTINSTLQNLDPYTRFYNEQQVEDYKIISEGEYGGIGARVKIDEGNIIIKEIYQNSPADKYGVLVGDVITQVDSTILKGNTGEYSLSLLKGLPDTELQLKILRQEKEINLTVVRETIEINPVPFYRMVNDDTGYIAFVKFNKKASDQVKEAFMDLKAQGMQKLIIDVRHNPGGLLSEAVEIVNFFIPRNQVVVYTKGKLSKFNKTFTTKSEPIDLEIPITILIDGKSASASEILAGALQDYDRAVIIGKRSYGKGLVQRTKKLAYGTQLKLTISKYYTPSGRCIQELDYANREGKVIPKFSDNGINEFKTANGRLVYDGGGVAPDIEITDDIISEATKQLLASDVLFNYITAYYFKNKTISQPENFELNQKDFQKLTKYLSENTLGFQLKSEQYFEKALEVAYEDAVFIDEEYSVLMDKLKAEKRAVLQAKESEILREVSKQIINRYYFKKGEYEYMIEKDNYVSQATELLNNSDSYNDILKK